jgi:hypothetical protein
VGRVRNGVDRYHLAPEFTQIALKAWTSSDSKHAHPVLWVMRETDTLPMNTAKSLRKKSLHSAISLTELKAQFTI